MKTVLKFFTLTISALVLIGCSGIPKGVDAVDDFELDRYLGTWYEIARLDHSFERDLTDVTASYTLREDSGVEVVNRGYNTRKNKWEEATGKAYFTGPSNEGRLKVSFFGPFYGGYNVIALDRENYQYAMVAGPSFKYLWILARSPDLDAAIVKRLVGQAEELGFPVADLIYVSHNQ